MTTPTRSNPLPESPGPAVRVGHPVGSAVQTYAGMFGALAGAAAASNQGFAVPYVAAVGVIPLGGQFSDEVLGTGIAENNADGAGRVLKRVAVTGVVNNATDLGKLVWAADSGPPLVLADPGNAIPFGFILDVTGTARADVWQFGLEAAAVLAIIANGAFAAFGTRVGNP
jgi:hypothetical protein